MISQPEQMPRVLEIAMQTSITRRGVSVINWHRYARRMDFDC